MKAYSKIFLILVLTGIGIIGSTKQVSAKAVAVGVNFETFHSSLSPYGRWVNTKEDGMIWVPNAAPGFRPYYTSGHWIYTSDGWTWVSDYPWGWAPFHYGRWVLNAGFGWAWVPGYEWAPAWVSWRHTPGYYGWAPLGPRVSVEIALGRGYAIPEEHWNFVGERYMGNPHIDRYYMPVARNHGFFRSSVIIGATHIDEARHVTFMMGPERAEVERFRGKKITPVVIHEYDKPGHKMQKGNLYIYRPDMARPRPSEVIVGKSPNVRTRTTAPIAPNRNVIRPEQQRNPVRPERGEKQEEHREGEHDRRR